MPIFDNQLIFCDTSTFCQQVGAGGTQFISTYELDFESTTLPPGVTGGAAGVSAQTQAYPDKGSGSILVCRILITADITGGTSIRFQLCFDTSTQTGGTTATTVVQTADLTIGTATKAGAYVPELKVPDEHARFCNFAVYVIGTTAAGSVTAFLDIVPGMRHR
jgi:hypothetical protein